MNEGRPVSGRARPRGPAPASTGRNLARELQAHEAERALGGAGRASVRAGRGLAPEARGRGQPSRCPGQPAAAYRILVTDGVHRVVAALPPVRQRRVSQRLAKALEELAWLAGLRHWETWEEEAPPSELLLRTGGGFVGRYTLDHAERTLTLHALVPQQLPPRGRGAGGQGR